MRQYRSCDAYGNAYLCLRSWLIFKKCQSPGFEKNITRNKFNDPDIYRDFIQEKPKQIRYQSTSFLFFKHVHLHKSKNDNPYENRSSVMAKI